MTKTPETLRDLLAEATGEYSLRQMADAAGYNSHQGIDHLVKGKVRGFPDPARIEGLAHLFRRPVGLTLLATARTLGMKVEPTPAIAWELPPEIDELTDTERTELLKMIRDYVAKATKRRRKSW